MQVSSQQSPTTDLPTSSAAGAAVSASSNNTVLDTMEVEQKVHADSSSSVLDDNSDVGDVGDAGDDENWDEGDEDEDADHDDCDDVDDDDHDVVKENVSFSSGDSAFDESFPNLPHAELQKRIDELVISPNVADALDVDQHFSCLSEQMQSRIRFMLSLDSEPSAKATLRQLRDFFKHCVPNPVPLVSTEVAAFKSKSNPVVLLLKGTNRERESFVA